MQFALDLAKKFFSKEKMIGMVSALVIAAAAAATSMNTQEFKTAVCGAPTLTLNK
jgi:hypothetical protein